MARTTLIFSPNLCCLCSYESLIDWELPIEFEFCSARRSFLQWERSGLDSVIKIDKISWYHRWKWNLKTPWNTVGNSDNNECSLFVFAEQPWCPWPCCKDPGFVEQRTRLSFSMGVSIAKKLLFLSVSIYSALNCP